MWHTHVSIHHFCLMCSFTFFMWSYVHILRYFTCDVRQFCRVLMQNSVWFIAVVSAPRHFVFPQELADSECVKFDNTSWFACKHLLTWWVAWNVVPCFLSGRTRFQEDLVTPHTVALDRECWSLSTLLTYCLVNPPGRRWIPPTRDSNVGLWYFFVLSPTGCWTNSNFRWFETIYHA